MRKLALSLALITALLWLVLPVGAVSRSVKFPCKPSGVARLDPIVNPDGSPSSHVHLFAGNTGTAKGDRTYADMIDNTTTCNFAGDTAAYWVAPMVQPDGTVISAKVTVYYDRMTSQKITAFPRDFRMIWGYMRGLFNSKPRSFYGWNCKNTESLQPTFASVDCRGNTGGQAYVTFRAFSPYCWDGTHTDSADHMSHVTYPPGYPTNQVCPSGTVAVPRLRVNFNFLTAYCPDCNITSDSVFGTAQGGSAHTDFWNTWQQSALEALVGQLNA
jgi:uncharacterized protein DUF1996